MGRKINPTVKPGEKRKGEEGGGKGGGRGKTDFTERENEEQKDLTSIKVMIDLLICFANKSMID